MKLNFIWTGGEFLYPYYLAVLTAMRCHTHTSATLYYIDWKPSPLLKLLKSQGLECVKISIPEEIMWLDQKPEPFRSAHLKDYFLWLLGDIYGGIFLDLDTISRYDISGMLHEGVDLVCGQDVAHPSECQHPYNNAVVLIRADSPSSAFLRRRSSEILRAKSSSWGQTGPELLTELFDSLPSFVESADFRVLGGYGGHERNVVYTPGGFLPERCHVIHAFAAASQEEFSRINPSWISASPSPYAEVVRSVLMESDYRPFRLEDWLHNRGDHYLPMFEYLASHPVRSILEIGTHRGDNAIGMLLTSQEPLDQMTYYGFDFFKPLSPTKVEEEVAKGYENPLPIEMVQRKISSLGVRTELHQGDTRISLPETDLPIVDFIYIDGGHSEETTQSDWKNVQKYIGPHTKIFVDDYFEGRVDIGAGTLLNPGVISTERYHTQIVGTPDDYGEFVAHLLEITPQYSGQASPSHSDKLRLHLLGLAHVPSHPQVSMCAYTQKVVKLSRMLTDLGHEVIFYGGEGSEVQCSEFVECISKTERTQCYGEYDWTKDFFKHSGSDLAYSIFNLRAIHEINRRKKPGDLLLVSMGNYQKPIADAVGLPAVESGIGYTGVFSNYRVFESQAWMHYIYGLLHQDNGQSYDCVIPNYFYPEDFPYREKKEDFFLYIGRLVYRKGVSIAVQVADILGSKLIIAGQGSLQDPVEGLNITSPNVSHIGSVGPAARADLMGRAKAVFVPTMYLEPFGGVAVEAQMCGTPVITSDWGAFPETVLHGQTGYRCHTLDDYVWAARNIDQIRPKDCRDWAVQNFGATRVAKMYDEYLHKIARLSQGRGWDDVDLDRTNLDWLTKTYVGGSA
ncbi:MAG: glycosyltransferase [Methanothrix sp.]|nr:glycosyltransferase [Methanothrix sp.]